MPPARPAPLIGTCAFSAALALAGCSAPTDAPIAWKYKIDLPLTNGRFNLGRMIGSLLPPQAAVIGLDSAGGPGDTLKVRVADSSRGAFGLQPDALKADRMARTLGSMAIRTPDTVSHMFELPAIGTLPTAIDTFIDASKERPLNGIRSIGCDSSSAPMPVRVENRSPAALSGFRLALSSGGLPIADTAVGTLGPGESRLIHVAMAGARLDGSVDIRVRTRAAAARGEVFPVGAGIRVAFSLNGLELARAEAMDTLLSFSKLYEQRFRISDTFDLAYLHFDARLDFSVRLDSRIGLRSTAEWVDLWDGEYCETRGLRDRKRLLAAQDLDSAAYRGNVGEFIVRGGAGPGERFSAGFANLRHFPRSDTLDGRQASLAEVRFRFAPLREGRWAVFDRGDSVVFAIEPRETRFAGFDARLRRTLLRISDTTGIPVAYPWEKERNDGLRGKVGFPSAGFLIQGRFRMPEGCSIDSLSLSVPMGSRGDPALSDTMSGAFAGLSDGSIAGIAKDLSRLLNALPGDLVFRPGIRVPQGSRIVWNAGSGTPAADSLRVDWDFRLDLPLAWTVSDTARLVVRDSFVVDEALARAERRMDVEAASLLLSIGNPTGFGMELTGLGAPRSGGVRLFAQADTGIVPAAAGRDPEAHWFSLVGAEPIAIGPSENAGPFTIRMEEEDFGRMLAKTGYCFLWRITLLPGTGVAIKAGDSFGIAASMRLEGVASMDTLLQVRR